jgi:PAS domain S-box-containing protein
MTVKCGHSHAEDRRTLTPGVKNRLIAKHNTDFQFLAEHSVDIVCRSGLDRVLSYVSPSSFSALGWKPEEMAGRLVDDFILAEDLPVLAAAIAAANESATVRMYKSDGSIQWMENRARLIYDSATGEPTGWVVTMRDITDRKSLEDKLSAQTLTDSLTDLANR